MKKFATIIMALMISLIMVATVSARVVQIDYSTVMVLDRINGWDGESFVDITDGIVARGVAKYVTILIDSPGGSAISMFQILDQMKELKIAGIHFTTINIREACSAGAYIWLMGDERKIISGSLFMFHSVVLYGPLGRVAEENIPSYWVTQIAKSNAQLHTIIVDLTGSEELADKFLGGGYGAENWYNEWEMKNFYLVDLII